MHDGFNLSELPTLFDLKIVKVAMPLDETKRFLSLKLALKISDLGHTTASLPVHLKWVSNLEDEAGTLFT